MCLLAGAIPMMVLLPTSNTPARDRLSSRRRPRPADRTGEQRRANDRALRCAARAALRGPAALDRIAARDDCGVLALPAHPGRDRDVAESAQSGTPRASPSSTICPRPSPRDAAPAQPQLHAASGRAAPLNVRLEHVRHRVPAARARGHALGTRGRLRRGAPAPASNVSTPPAPLPTPDPAPAATGSNTPVPAGTAAVLRPRKWSLLRLRPRRLRLLPQPRRHHRRRRPARP